MLEVFFADPATRTLCDALAAAGVVTGAVKAPPAETLAGLTFVLTGTLPTLTREEASERIKAAGGKVSGSLNGLPESETARPGWPEGCRSVMPAGPCPASNTHFPCL
jgi:hypothetical protein